MFARPRAVGVAARAHAILNTMKWKDVPAATGVQASRSKHHSCVSRGTRPLLGFAFLMTTVAVSFAFHFDSLNEGPWPRLRTGCRVKS
jgi:hypothetical protein